MPNNGVGTPDAPSREEVEDSLRVSQQIRAEAEIKVVQADETAQQMSSTLRRLARIIDRNPKSWDELFANGEVR